MEGARSGGRLGGGGVNGKRRSGMVRWHGYRAPGKVLTSVTDSRSRCRLTLHVVVPGHTMEDGRGFSDERLRVCKHSSTAWRGDIHDGTGVRYS